MGRPKLAPEIKKAKGTFRADRESGNPNAPNLPEAPENPEVPGYLTEHGRNYYKTYYPLLRKAGVIRATDLDAFFYLCYVRQELMLCDEIIAREGQTIIGSKDNEVRHPAALARREYAAEFAKLIPMFGLTPSGRNNLNIAVASTEPNGPVARDRKSGPKPPPKK